MSYTSRTDGANSPTPVRRRDALLGSGLLQRRPKGIDAVEHTDKPTSVRVELREAPAQEALLVLGGRELERPLVRARALRRTGRAGAGGRRAAEWK